MRIQDIINHLEEIAPSAYQESYDNSGLIVGNAKAEVTGALLCLDSTEAVLDEAIELGCNLIIAHHPIVFRGLKRFTGKDYVERVVMKAIKNDLAIYAIHTNLDNVYYQGVNAKFAEKLNLQNTRILAPKKGLLKLVTSTPPDHSDKIRQALFAAGAGQLNGFKQLSHAGLGVGSEAGHSVAEVRLEVLFPAPLRSRVIQALHQSHPSTQVAYEIMPVENKNQEIGSGMIGELKEPMAEKAFLGLVKKNMKASMVRYTKLRGKRVKKVAICGGSGGFLLSAAKSQKADIFITSDYKYHEFFDADGQLVIADIGHYETEQFTIELLHEIITNKFSNFAAHCTKVNTNPVNYL